MAGVTLQPVDPGRLLHEIWLDIVEHVLHDSVGYFNWGYERRSDAHGENEIVFCPEACYWGKVGRLWSDRQLLFFWARSVPLFSVAEWTSGRLSRAFSDAINHSSHGYAMTVSHPSDERVVLCPAAVVCAVLACMVFRIPSGSREAPRELSFCCHFQHNLEREKEVLFEIKTRSPVSAELLDRVQRKDHFPWDPWHHAWIVARRWAGRFGGRCDGEIGIDDGMSVRLILPGDDRLGRALPSSTVDLSTSGAAG